MTSEHPEITALEGALDRLQLRLSVGAPEPHLETRSYRRVHLTTGPEGARISVAVDDEYDDATPNNQPLLLHLVLAECELYEDAEDLLSWAKETGFDPAEDWVRALYNELGVAVQQVRDLAGNELKALSPHDISLNAGAAQALRGRRR